MQPHTEPAKLIRFEQVLPLYGTAETRFRQDVREGLMTSPIKPSRKLSLWPESELTAINAARLAGRKPDEIRALVQQLHAKRKTDADAILAGV